MMDRGRRRTLRFGLQTVLGLKERGFFVPLRTAPLAAGWRNRRYEALEATFRAAEPAIARHLDRIEGFAPALAGLDGPPPEPRFSQTWFPRLDAAALYALMRAERPERVVEVGSGHSTRFLVRAARDEAHPAAITAIDPEPRADLMDLPLTLVGKPLQEVGLEPFAGIGSGDLVAIDSSHVMMPGTDVDILINHILPRLPSGTFVSVHDVFLPAPYPAVWPFTAYNEQNALAPLLQGRAEIVFASAYALEAMADAVRQTWIGRQPLPDGARESLIILRLN